MVSGSTYCYAAIKAKRMQCLSEFIYLYEVDYHIQNIESHHYKSSS